MDVLKRLIKEIFGLQQTLMGKHFINFIFINYLCEIDITTKPKPKKI